jgi:hypothetical protein
MFEESAVPSGASGGKKNSDLLFRGKVAPPECIRVEGRSQYPGRYGERWSTGYTTLAPLLRIRSGIWQSRLA